MLKFFLKLLVFHRPLSRSQRAWQRRDQQVLAAGVCRRDQELQPSQPCPQGQTYGFEREIVAVTHRVYP